MNMQICARCKKRPAVIFITRMEKDKTINEGICIKCAKELGLKPVDDIMQKMGLTDEDLDRPPIIRRIWRGAPRPLTSGSCSAG